MTTMAQEKKPLRVACIGDSLTEGYTQRGSRFLPYSAQLAARLSELGAAANADVHNFGRSGELTEQILDRALQDVFTEKVERWDIVVILAGTNDLGYRVPLDEIMENLKDIGDLAKAHGCTKVFYMTIPPVSAFLNDPDYHEAKCEINRRIRQMCLDDSLLETIDLFMATVSATDGRSGRKEVIDVGGLHFTKAGYDIMAQIVAAAIANWLKATCV